MQILDFVRDLSIVAGIAGVLGLDRRGAFQLMLGQPVVAVWLLGLCLGQPVVGLQLGAVLQLLWMSSSLFGASVPPNETVASLAIGGMVFLVNHHLGQPPPGQTLMAAATLLGAPLCWAGRHFEIRNDRANSRLMAQADTYARDGNLDALARLPLVGLGRMFLLNAGLVTVAAALGFGVLVALTPALLSVAPRTALAVIALYVLPAVGIGVALSHLRLRMGLVLALIAFVVMRVLQENGVVA